MVELLAATIRVGDLLGRMLLAGVRPGKARWDRGAQSAPFQGRPYVRAVIYIRVSTAEQADPTHFSLPEQERVCRELAAERGWTVVQVYSDEGVSARYDNPNRRPAFAAMLADAQAGLFDVVIVHKLDRYARTLQGALEWLHFLEKAGTLLVSATERFDFTTPDGRLLFQLLCAFAEYFLNNLRVNVSLGWDGRAEEGYWRGDPPFGYCRGQCPECKEPDGPQCERYQKAEPLGPARELYAHPWNSRGLVMAFETYAYRAENYRDVSDALNNAGYRTKCKLERGGPQLFTPDAIRLILHNEFYRGLVRVRDWSAPGKHYGTVPGRHPPLIPPELWDCVQGKLAHNAARPPRNPKRVRPYRISGVGRCARCGGPLTGQFSGGRRVYYCSERCEHGKDPSTGGCDLPGLYADECEAAVLALLEQIAIPAADRERILADMAGRPRPNGGPSPASLQEKLDRLTWLYQEGDVTQEDYRRRKAALQSEMARTRVPEPVEVVRAVDLLTNIGQAWRVATDDQTQRGLLQAMFEGLFFDGPNRTPALKSVRPQPAFLPYWDLLNRGDGVEGIRTGMFPLPQLR